MNHATALVVRYRQWIRAALVVIALGFACAIPSLEVRFAPEELVAPDDDAARASEAMHLAFGPDEEVLLVLVEGDDVLAPEILDWSHQMAQFLAGRPGIAVVT